MIKTRRGRPPKKTVIDSFVKEEKKAPEIVKEEAVGIFCDCGKPVVAGDHQCWDCQHRA